MNHEQIRKELHRIKSSLSFVRVFVDSLIKDGSDRDRLIQEHHSRYENAMKQIEEAIKKIDDA
ncbi:MAG: hypothetical protein FJ240_13310 [Nitrospira sp.]|nr:hypothetical protein [Nitrospira sp.]